MTSLLKLTGLAVVLLTRLTFADCTKAIEASTARTLRTGEREGYRMRCHAINERAGCLVEYEQEGKVVRTRKISRGLGMKIVGNAIRNISPEFRGRERRADFSWDVCWRGDHFGDSRSPATAREEYPKRVEPGTRLEADLHSVINDELKP